MLKLVLLTSGVLTKSYYKLYNELVAPDLYEVHMANSSL